MSDSKAQRLMARIRENREARRSPAVLANDFAASRGWRVSRPFNVERLYARQGTTVDRRKLVGEAFTYFAEDYPCAVAVHGTFEQLAIARRYANRHSLRVEDIECWHRPGSNAVLLRRALWQFGRIN